MKFEMESDENSHTKYAVVVDEDGANMIVGPNSFAQRIGYGRNARSKAKMACEVLNGYTPGHFVVLKTHRKLHIMGEDLDGITMSQKFSKTICGALVDLKSDAITETRPGNMQLCSKCEKAYRLMGGEENPNQITFTFHGSPKKPESKK